MRRVAATTSWGVGLVLILAVPVTALAQIPAVPPVPAPPQTPPQKAAPPAPAPPPNLYERSWEAPLDLKAPAALVVTSHTALLAGSLANATPDLASRVVAFNLDDGKERWHTDVQGVTALAADDERTIVGLPDSLAAFDTAAGIKRWSAAGLGGPMQLVDRSGWVAVARGADLAALRASDGTTVWRQTFGPQIVGSPRIDGDALFVLLADGRLVRIGLTTGEIQWSIDLDAGATEILAANDRLYVSLSDGRLMVYRELNGRYTWHYNFSAQAVGAGISDTHNVYLSLRDNSVQAIDRGLGNLRWKAPLPERLATAPLLTANVVVMPLAGGEIDIAVAKDGKTAGKIAAPAPPAGTPGASLQLLSLAVAPNDTILRVVKNDDDTLTLAAFRRPPPVKK